MSKVNIVKSSRELTNLEAYMCKTVNPPSLKDSELVGIPIKVNFMAEVTVVPESTDKFEEFSYVLISTDKGCVRTSSESVLNSLQTISDEVGFDEPGLGIIFRYKTSKKVATRKYMVAEVVILGEGSGNPFIN